MVVISPNICDICADEFEFILALVDARSNLNLCNHVLV